ncbi:acryloyl-CoA reductase [Erwinia sp. CPCC 100877]|nr:acryloyl-CoA reductase [Erwinia sp. CPCC 100877]
MENFSGLVVNKQEDTITSTIETLTVNQLSQGEVLIEVAYSSVNFKDSLALKADGGVIRDYPMIPGIDLSGTIVSSADERFSVGQEVLVTGYGTGVSHTGGFAEYARIPADWLVPLPHGLRLKDAMIIGTAGFTAALSIDQLEKNGLAENKEAAIYVTGASGGVGSLAIAMLKQLNYSNIIALSRKKEAIDKLTQLGASQVILLDDFLPEKSKPLAKQTIDFAIDTVGGNVTSALLAQLRYGGSIALSGNAAGIALNTTVLPFILRGVHLLGIDSVNVLMNERLKVWSRLATDLNICQQAITNETTLKELPEILAQLQAGTHIGRTIVKLK